MIFFREPYQGSPPFDMRLGSELIINKHVESMAEFQAIDATPMFTDIERKSIDDYRIFREAPQEAPQEIYLEKASLAEVLDIALSKQESNQAEIRERMLREQQAKQMSDIHTNLRLVI